jgi:predicted transcriptional regulator
MAAEETKPAEQAAKPQVEETKPAEQAAKPQVEETKPAEQAAKPQVEKQTNCLACNKQLKKLKRYYRDGKFYCSKICWRNYIAKLKEEKK